MVTFGCAALYSSASAWISWNTFSASPSCDHSVRDTSSGASVGGTAVGSGGLVGATGGAVGCGATVVGATAGWQADSSTPTITSRLRIVFRVFISSYSSRVVSAWPRIDLGGVHP